MVMIGEKRLLNYLIVFILSSCVVKSNNDLKLEFICLSLRSEDMDSSKNIVWQIDSTLQMHYHRGAKLSDAGDFCSQLSTLEWERLEMAFFKMPFLDSALYVFGDSINTNDLFEFIYSINGKSHRMKGDYFKLSKEFRAFLMNNFESKSINLERCNFFPYYKSRLFMEHVSYEDTPFVKIPFNWFDSI